jgi:hypothetical protein
MSGLEGGMRGSLGIGRGVAGGFHIRCLGLISDGYNFSYNLLPHLCNTRKPAIFGIEIALLRLQVLKITFGSTKLYTRAYRFGSGH